MEFDDRKQEPTVSMLTKVYWENILHLGIWITARVLYACHPGLCTIAGAKGNCISRSLNVSVQYPAPPCNDISKFSKRSKPFTYPSPGPWGILTSERKSMGFRSGLWVDHGNSVPRLITDGSLSKLFVLSVFDASGFCTVWVSNHFSQSVSVISLE